MTDHLRGFRMSSARRAKSRPSLVTASVVVVVVILTILAVRQSMQKTPVHDPLPTPQSPPTEVPTQTPTVTPTVLVERSSEWVEALVPTATPSPWPTFAQPPAATVRPEATPTPLTSQCVTHRWTASQVFSPSAQVLVEIEAVNRCDRDFGPLELWFEITGWRQGDLIQSVRGHPFDRIRAGRSGIVAIGLPGSLDWYDEITVKIID